jgi:hypothetical protein
MGIVGRKAKLAPNSLLSRSIAECREKLQMLEREQKKVVELQNQLDALTDFSIEEIKYHQQHLAPAR